LFITCSFISIPSIYIGTPSREYMSARVHMNNGRIWTIEERIQTDEKWLLHTNNTLLLIFESVGHYRCIVLKRGEI
jgi:hypothetical protein